MLVASIVGIAVLTFETASLSCVGFTADAVAKDEAIHAVFDATVTEVEQATHSIYRASVTVHTVWKGEMRQHASVYFQEGMNQPSLRVGQRYVLMGVAVRNASAQHLWPMMAEGSVFVPECHALAHDLRLRVIEGLGRGHRPLP
jgi:hypothetical protein